MQTTLPDWLQREHDRLVPIIQDIRTFEADPLQTYVPCRSHELFLLAKHIQHLLDHIRKA